MVTFAFVGVGPERAQLRRGAPPQDPVEGWKRMQVDHSNRVIWVTPTAGIAASDIEQAQPKIRADGYQIIRVVFTDAGVSKLHDLTAAQLKKLIVLVVDDKVIWAPMVMYVAGPAAKNNVLTGNTPHGLTPEEVDRIMAILR